VHTHSGCVGRTDRYAVFRQRFFSSVNTETLLMFRALALYTAHIKKNATAGRGGGHINYNMNPLAGTDAEKSH